MKKEDLNKAFKECKNSPKRNFKQSYELIVTLKGLNMKNPDNHVDLYVQLPKGVGKPKKVCALIGAELKESAKNVDKFILVDDFPKFDGKKKDIKKLANEFDFFIAQATIMPKKIQRTPNPWGHEIDRCFL